MARTTFTANIRSKGGSEQASIAQIQMVLAIPVAPAAAGIPGTVDVETAPAASGFVLPKNAVILDVKHNLSTTGGTTPTFVVGVEGDTDAYVADAPTNSDELVSCLDQSDLGVSAGAGVTADTELFIGAGTGTAGSATTGFIFIEYAVVDLGVQN